MSLKPFTFEGRFECGFDELVKNRVCALVAVMAQDRPNRQPQHGVYGLGLAIANEDGYYPIPLHWCHGDSWREMQEHADALNAELFKLDKRQAARIVCTTMFRTPAREQL